MLKTVALRSHFVVLTFPVQLQTESQFQLGADGVLLPHLCQRHWIWHIFIFDLCSWQLYFYNWTLLDLKVFISPVSLGNKTLSIGGYSGGHFPTKSKHFPKNWCYKKVITQWPILGKGRFQGKKAAVLLDFVQRRRGRASCPIFLAPFHKCIFGQ